jgi:hypothetical protein
MDVTAVLRESLKVIKDADTPADLRAAALGPVIKLVASQAPGAPDRALVPYQAPGPTTVVAAGDPVVRLATKLGVPRDAVEAVYTNDGNQLDISVHPARLPRSKSTGTKAIALLVTALRQASGEEEFTPVDEIRRVAQDFDRYDGPNFASAIGELRGSFLVKGSARQRQLKLTRPGWQQAADLVRDLGEGSVR